MRSIHRATILLLLLAIMPGAGVCLADQAIPQAGDEVARVAQCTGKVTLERGATRFSVGQGDRLKRKDTLITGADGSVGIVFNDETTISLGPGSELNIQDYDFDPARSRFTFIVSLLKGTAAYVSGLIAKISPEAAKFITPSASIGIRGTKFVIEVEAL